MADFNERHPLTAPGRYYTDGTCAECGSCRSILPACVKHDRQGGGFYFARQPQTDEEIALAEECVASCPHDAMGNDGDEFDWGQTVTATTTTPCDSPTCGRPWWKMW
jgi:ferredoxin